MATEFFLFLLKPRRGDRRFSAAPTGAHTGKENKVRGLSFTNGSRRGLFSAVPSALKASATKNGRACGKGKSVGFPGDRESTGSGRNDAKERAMRVSVLRTPNYDGKSPAAAKPE